MPLLGAIAYDPATAQTKGTAASAMALFESVTPANARISFTVPSSGRVMVRIACTIHGATTCSTFLLGVMEGATVRGKVPAAYSAGNIAATSMLRAEAIFPVTGLTPGAALSWDPAWGCETFVAASLLKYGGPANATANNDFGALIFEIWNAG